MNNIIICHIDGFSVPDEIINDNKELNKAIVNYSKSLASEIWKQEENYVIHENGIDAAFYERDLKLV